MTPNVATIRCYRRCWTCSTQYGPARMKSKRPRPAALERRQGRRNLCVSGPARGFSRSPSDRQTRALCFPRERTGARMNKDQIKGSAKEVKGKVKEIAGRVIGNPRVEAEGDDEQLIGKVQKTYGDIKNEANKSR